MNTVKSLEYCIMKKLLESAAKLTHMLYTAWFILQAPGALGPGFVSFIPLCLDEVGAQWIKKDKRL